MILVGIYFPTTLRGSFGQVFNQLLSKIATGKTRYEYDILGRLLKEVGEDTRIAKHYGYDKNGNRTSFKMYTEFSDLQQDLTYSYDKLNRVTNIKESNSAIASYTYDKNSNILTENNVVADTVYDYNLANLVIEKTTENVNNQQLFYDSYGYYADGNLYMEGNKGYVYDKQNRLINANDLVYGEVVKNDYTFDSRGNRTTRTDETDSVMNYTYDKNNRILSMTDGLTKSNYSYDDRGNLYLKTVAVLADSSTTATAEAFSMTDTE